MGKTLLTGCNKEEADLTRCKWLTQERQADVYAIPDAGTGKGISHESLPDAAETHRNGARPMPDGATDQNLVSKSTHETEEGNPGDQRTERAGKTGAGTEGGRRCGGANCVASGSKLVGLIRLDAGDG